MRLMLTQLSTKLELKLKLSLAIYFHPQLILRESVVQAMQCIPCYSEPGYQFVFLQVKQHYDEYQLLRSSDYEHTGISKLHKNCITPHNHIFYNTSINYTYLIVKCHEDASWLDIVKLGLKLNTKITLNHHHPPPPQTFLRVLGCIGG